MLGVHHTTTKHLFSYLFIILGAALAAFAIEVFFIPNNLIDGGIVGVAMIIGQITGEGLFPFFYIGLNAPFVYLAYRYIGKSFLAQMFCATVMFFTCSVVIEHWLPSWVFHGDKLEVVVVGGALLGIGLGIVIRCGGCIDGTEILGIIVNRRTGLTVGQVVLVCNIFVFGAAGIVFQDWHPPLLSLIAYLVVVKVMDAVIVGLDETKSVWIISSKSKEIAEALIHELGLGLTILYGRGGFSGDAREILYVIAERLQLAELKELVYREDPVAFIAIENLHEVANGNQISHASKKRTPVKALIRGIFQSKNTPLS